MVLAVGAERVSSPLVHFDEAGARSAQSFFARNNACHGRVAELCARFRSAHMHPWMISMALTWKKGSPLAARAPQRAEDFNDAIAIKNVATARYDQASQAWPRL